MYPSPIFAQQYRSQSSASTNVGNPPIPAGGGVPPSNNDCNGKYAHDLSVNTWKVNFGDPVCDYTKDKLYQKLQQEDNAHIYCWFYVIVKGESGYDPNAEQLYDPVDPAHAWGNYQMGRGGNGQLDHGDVDWILQTTNAIDYNKQKIGGSFAYWGTARRDPADCHP